jgi:hypothetical protein
MSPIQDPTDQKRRAAYLARGITRNDHGAIAALDREFPGEAKRIEEYRKAYHDHLHPNHKKMVEDVASWYATAGDWLE